jgi:hypothetical protein
MNHQHPDQSNQGGGCNSCLWRAPRITTDKDHGAASHSREEDNPEISGGAGMQQSLMHGDNACRKRAGDWRLFNILRSRQPGAVQSSRLYTSRAVAKTSRPGKSSKKPSSAKHQAGLKVKHSTMAEAFP